MNMMLSAALITLATTGNPVDLQADLGGEIVENLDTNTSVLKEGEHYAPPALVVNGTTYRMVAPTVATDNFIIQTGDLLIRLDAGVSEGDNVLRVVSASSTMGNDAHLSGGESFWSRFKGRLGLGDPN
jgi:hypothetical protein